MTHSPDQVPEPPPIQRAAPPTTAGPTSAPGTSVSGKAAYNIVSDTVIGVNLRWRDNLFQAIAVVVFAVIGAFIGMLMASEPLPGAIIGAIAGLLAGAIISGIALFIFRSIRHLQGKHD